MRLSTGGLIILTYVFTGYSKDARIFFNQAELAQYYHVLSKSLLKPL